MEALQRGLVSAVVLAALESSGNALAQQPADCSSDPIPDRALELSIGS